MPLNTGTRLGPYEILSPIGAGGMGEVYRARDTKLNRDVALKILPEAFVTDGDRLARFKREAQVLASLNHSNIAQIYGFEDASATHALVMELVDGPTLEELIRAKFEAPPSRDASADRHSLGVGGRSSKFDVLEWALPIARQIAQALECAHESGIIHRDLKPANIKLKGAWGPTPTRLPDGRLEPTLSTADVAGCMVKVLDFGLAKALAPEGANATADAMNSPTLTTPAMTQMGLILGTAAYMSPEQAKGRAVDKRADIWAFGVVLYEMLTGRRLFDAEDVSETLAAVLTRDVGGATLPQDLPVRLRALLGDCLVRNPQQRLRDIGDARIVLDKIIAGAPDDVAAATAPAAPRPRWRALVWPAVTLTSLAAAAASAALLWLQPAPVVPDIVQFSVTVPDGVIIRAHRLSPDGRMLALGASEGSKGLIWMHTFATGTARALPATEGIASGLFAWSPDSKDFLFTTEGKLRKASADGGPSQIIATLPAGRGYLASWGSRDVILLGSAGNAGGPLFRLAATGGELVPATELDAARNEKAHKQPTFLPNGRDFFFTATGPEPLDRVAYLGSLDSLERRPLPGITSEVLYSSGRVFFVRDGSVMSQPFDPERLELGGTASPVIEDITPQGAPSAPYSVSLNGTLAYRATALSTSQLVWFDRTGRRLEPAGPVAEYADIELSPDERYVAFESGRPGDIWVLDMRNGVTQRVTSDAGRDADPVWSPDGKTIAFRSDREGGRLYSRAVGVVGEDKPMLKSETRDSPVSWSRDGKYLTFETSDGIFALPLTGDPKPFRVTETTTGINRGASQISPDGRWVAYHSTELGQQFQSEVFIQSFPESGAKQRVSSAGGRTPRWSPDGQELYYLTPEDMLMSAAVKTAGGSLNVGMSARLFKVSLVGGNEGEYAVSSTGRFLLNVPAKAAEPPVTVILNWARGVHR